MLCDGASTHLDVLWEEPSYRRFCEQLASFSRLIRFDKRGMGLSDRVRAGTLELPNCDFDSGKATKAAEYSLTDDTYAKLLAQLTVRKFDLTTPALRDDVLLFYSDLSAPIETKKDTAQWQAVLTSLDQLRSVTPIPPVAAGAAQRSPSQPVATVTVLTKSSLVPATEAIQ